VKSAEPEGQDADDEQMDFAASEFRYERDLITTDETEAWLQQWELSIEEWMDYIRRSVIRARRGPLANTVEANGVVGDELDLCVYAEAVFSGCVQRVAAKLAGWASVYQKAVEEQWTKPIASSDPITLLQHMEAAYREYRSRTLSPESLAAQVRLRRLEWMRFVCRYMLLSDENMVRKPSSACGKTRCLRSRLRRTRKRSSRIRRFISIRSTENSLLRYLPAARGI
jgi:hypothetical protein